jgi:hypothetical protein
VANWNPFRRYPLVSIVAATGPCILVQAIKEATQTNWTWAIIGGILSIQMVQKTPLNRKKKSP